MTILRSIDIVVPRDINDLSKGNMDVTRDFTSHKIANTFWGNLKAGRLMLDGVTPVVFAIYYDVKPGRTTIIERMPVVKKDITA